MQIACRQPSPTLAVPFGASQFEMSLNCNCQSCMKFVSPSVPLLLIPMSKFNSESALPAVEAADLLQSSLSMLSIGNV